MAIAVARDRWRPSAFLAGPAALFLIGFFVGPLLLGIGVSLGVGRVAGSATSLSIAHYARILGDAYYLEVMLATFLLALAVRTVATCDSAIRWPSGVSISIRSRLDSSRSAGARRVTTPK